MIKNFRTATLAKSLYQQCHRLAVRGALRDQLERASLSIYLNLVEGSAKPTLKEQRKFYYISLGSLREVQALLDLIDAHPELQTADQLGGCLYSLIRSLDSR